MGQQVAFRSSPPVKLPYFWLKPPLQQALPLPTSLRFNGA